MEFNNLNIQQFQENWAQNKSKYTILKDLTNQRFGRLLVLGLDEDFEKTRGKKQRRWVCQCDCGVIKSIIGAELTRSDKPQRSCGCSAHERALNFGQITAKDLTGKIFGKLFVNQKVGTNQQGYTIWECICECGNICQIASRELLSGDTKSCGCLARESFSYWETYITNKLKELKITFKQEYKFNDLKDKTYLRFDFALFKNDELVGLIEYQGEQHYNINNPFYNPDIIRHDQMKKDYCQKKNIPLFEIKYTDTDNIDNLLIEILRKI